jgi:uncharacterized membrane protein
MSFPANQIEFNRNAVQPIECIKAGFELIKSQYWLFVGITAVGIIIGAVVPLGIVMGPMMCGIYLALFKTRRRQPIEFGMLFKGFDYFADALIATLIHVVPLIIILIPTYIVFVGLYLGMFLTIIASEGDPNLAAIVGFIASFMVLWLVVLVLIVVVSILFTFTYPLIVDRRLSGLNAVKLSMRAGLANFWRLLGLLLLTALMNIVGAVFCYVGAFLALPIGFAAIAVAYEQVFGLGNAQPNAPPPPPSFA